MAVPQAGSNYLALDVGAKRIGVANAHEIARLAHPLTTIPNDADVWQNLAGIIERESVGTVVVGLPRNLKSEDTLQTKTARSFAEELSTRLNVSVHMQDEALTSHKAEAELASRKSTFEKGDIDALAATYILEDYLQEHHRG